MAPIVTETAPDGSTVNVLARTSKASVIHCALAPGAVSRAVRHVSVDEIWYCLSGVGQLWIRGADGVARIHALAAGVLVTLPAAGSFQFRNDGLVELGILITTIPPWPGAHEAQRCDDYWVPKI